MDAHDLIEIERRLAAAVDELQKRAAAVAIARQVKEFVGDQKKMILARYAAPLLKDSSNAVAETTARAEQGYREEMAGLMEQYRRAESHIATWDALHCKVDALRSTLSLAKEQIRL